MTNKAKKNHYNLVQVKIIFLRKKIHSALASCLGQHPVSCAQHHGENLKNWDLLLPLVSLWSLSKGLWT